MEFRAALGPDADRLREIARAAYAQYVPRIGREPAPMVEDFAARIAEGVVTVLEVGGAVVGYAVAFPKAGALQIENIAIDPAFQGRGFGAAFMGHLEAGQSCITLYTNATMVENIAFYQRLGYKVVDRRREAGFDRIYFRKEVGHE